MRSCATSEKERRWRRARRAIWLRRAGGSRNVVVGAAIGASKEATAHDILHRVLDVIFKLGSRITPPEGVRSTQAAALLELLSFPCASQPRTHRQLSARR